MIAVYLDSNIWLSFYELTDDTLDELAKLPEWVRQGQLHLPLPQQVVDEVKRNRERVISRSLAIIDKAQQSKVGWPRSVHDFAQRKELDQLHARFEHLRTAMRSELLDRAMKRTLPADVTIMGIVDGVDAIPATEDLIQRAERRRDFGTLQARPGRSAIRSSGRHSLRPYPTTPISTSSRGMGTSHQTLIRRPLIHS